MPFEITLIFSFYQYLWHSTNFLKSNKTRLFSKLSIQNSGKNEQFVYWNMNSGAYPLFKKKSDLCTTRQITSLMSIIPLGVVVLSFS